MLESNSAFQQLDSDSDLSTPDILNIESILLVSRLPKDVRTAPISQVVEHLIDSKEISRLTEPTPLQNDDLDYIERLRIRHEALTFYLGSILTCVLIHLPGVTYTIEIDPVAKAIVHWEWQRA